MRNKAKQQDEFALSGVTEVNWKLQERLEMIQAEAAVRKNINIEGRKGYDKLTEELNAMTDAAVKLQLMSDQGQFDTIDVTEGMLPEQIKLIEKQNEAGLGALHAMKQLNDQMVILQQEIGFQQMVESVQQINTTFDSTTASIEASSRVSDQFRVVGERLYDSLEAKASAYKTALTELYTLQAKGALDLEGALPKNRQAVEDALSDMKRYEQGLEDLKVRMNIKGDS